MSNGPHTKAKINGGRARLSGEVDGAILGVGHCSWVLRISCEVGESKMTPEPQDVHACMVRGCVAELSPRLTRPSPQLRELTEACFWGGFGVYILGTNSASAIRWIALPMLLTCTAILFISARHKGRWKVSSIACDRHVVRVSVAVGVLITMSISMVLIACLAIVWSGMRQDLLQWLGLATALLGLVAKALTRSGR